MNITHLVKIYFDQRTMAIDQAWLDRRYRFFAEHTLVSLAAQRFKDFRLWFCCGPNMWDKISGLREVSPVGSLFSFLSPTPQPGEHVAYQSGGNALITDLQRIHESDYVFVTRIDSDDLYSRDALEIAHNCLPRQPGRIEASIFARGYMLDTRTGRVGVYTNPSSPFHTLMIPTPIFLDEAKYNTYPIGDHSVVRSAFPCQVLPDWKFAVLIHGKNFLSDFSYGREIDTPVEKDWTLAKFMQQPVTFDVDDFCDEWNCLEDLLKLRERYPNFKATLFTIPCKTSLGLLRAAKAFDWIELGVHGITHKPNEELMEVSGGKLHGFLNGLIQPYPEAIYAPVFRPPGWYIKEEHVEACNRAGLAVALHVRDQSRLGPLCEHGHYVCGTRPHWHGHTHRVCNNWIRDELPSLLTMWPEQQEFSFVSESLLEYPK